MLFTKYSGAENRGNGTGSFRREWDVSENTSTDTGFSQKMRSGGKALLLTTNPRSVKAAGLPTCFRVKAHQQFPTNEQLDAQCISKAPSIIVVSRHSAGALTVGRDGIPD